MDKILLESTSLKAYIGSKEVRLCSYSATLESELECSIYDLECLNISDYPENLIIEFPDTDGVVLPFFKYCQLYRSDENFVRLNVFFTDDDGLLDSGVGINALTRKAKEVMTHSENIACYEIEEEVGWCCIVREYLLQKVSLKNAIKQDLEAIAVLFDRTGLTQGTKPVIYVEGITDVMILTTAWKKLHGENAPLPYSIRSCDLLSDVSEDGGAGGVNSLIARINGIGPDIPHFVIGLLDRDKEGIDAWNKRIYRNLFMDVPEIDAKVSKNGRCALSLLPIPSGKERFSKFHNLCIEYYFSEIVLSQKTTEGEGLQFISPKQIYQIGEIRKEIVIEDKEARKVAGNKRKFAENIVPTLNSSEFENFRIIFEHIENIVDYLQHKDR